MGIMLVFLFMRIKPFIVNRNHAHYILAANDAAVRQCLIPAKDMIADCAEEVRLEVVGKCCGLNILKNDPVGTVASVAIENMRLVAEKVATDESAMERYQDLIIIDSEISTKYFNCVAYPASVEGTEFI